MFYEIGPFSELRFLNWKEIIPLKEKSLILAQFYKTFFTQICHLLSRPEPTLAKNLLSVHFSRKFNFFTK